MRTTFLYFPFENNDDHKKSAFTEQHNYLRVLICIANCFEAALKRKENARIYFQNDEESRGRGERGVRADGPAVASSKQAQAVRRPGSGFGISPISPLLPSLPAPAASSQAAT